MKIVNLFMLLFAIAVFQSCGGGDADKSAKSHTSAKPKKEKVNKFYNPLKNKGIGPVKSLTLPKDVDQAMATKGKEIYEAKCTACHKATKKHIGPAPVGIFKRRSPEWIMNMILNPTEMVAKDPDAKKLLMEFNGSPMADQNLKEEEARSVLEYFRTL